MTAAPAIDERERLLRAAREEVARAERERRQSEEERRSAEFFDREERERAAGLSFAI